MNLLAQEAFLVSVLAQLILILLAARAMNLLFVRLGQPGAVGEIVAGLMLGPSLLGALVPQWHAGFFAPDTALTLFVLGQLGLILLMFEIGAGFEYGQLADRRLKRAVIVTAVLSVSVPFAAGVLLGLASHGHFASGIDQTAYSLFVGVALAITAVPILGRILRGFGLEAAPVGVVAISAAALNDAVGWLILAAIAAFVSASLTDGFILWRLAALAVLGVALRFLLLPFAAWLVGRFGATDPARPLSPPLVAIVIAIAFGLAIVTERIGIFAIFGGFLAGLAFHRHQGFVARWQADVGRFVTIFFLPVFFTLTGLRTDIFGLALADLPWMALVLVVAILSKLLPCYLAGRLSGFSRGESAALGTLMNTRALMELIVLNIALDLGVLPPAMFTILVVMAVVTTLMTGPVLKRLLPHLDGAKPVTPERLRDA
jgi:Kef-type K+ transport system membrane component KefB